MKLVLELDGLELLHWGSDLNGLDMLDLLHLLKWLNLRDMLNILHWLDLNRLNWLILLELRNVLLKVMILLLVEILDLLHWLNLHVIVHGHVVCDWFISIYHRILYIARGKNHIISIGSHCCLVNNLLPKIVRYIILGWHLRNRLGRNLLRLDAFFRKNDILGPFLRLLVINTFYLSRTSW